MFPLPSPTAPELIQPSSSPALLSPFIREHSGPEGQQNPWYWMDSGPTFTQSGVQSQLPSELCYLGLVISLLRTSRMFVQRLPMELWHSVYKSLSTSYSRGCSHCPVAILSPSPILPDPPLSLFPWMTDSSRCIATNIQSHKPAQDWSPGKPSIPTNRMAVVTKAPMEVAAPIPAEAWICLQNTFLDHSICAAGEWSLCEKDISVSNSHSFTNFLPSAGWRKPRRVQNLSPWEQKQEHSQSPVWSEWSSRPFKTGRQSIWDEYAFSLSRQPWQLAPDSWNRSGPARRFLIQFSKSFLSTHQESGPTLGAVWQMEAGEGKDPRLPLGLPFCRRGKVYMPSN